jgi:predicted HTH domain antitoxin
MTTYFPNQNQTESLQIQFTLSVHNIPESVQEKATAKAKEAYIMKLLEAGEISSGKAATLLEIPRSEVIQQLFDDSLELEELKEEIEQANLILEQDSQ